MHKLRISPNPNSGDLAPDEIAEALLVEAGAVDQFPTNERKLLDFLELKPLSFDFAKEFDFLSGAQEPPQMLRAALSIDDKVIATHSALGEKRFRFSVLHEVAHYVLPEHRRVYVDTDETLSWRSKLRMEREANQMAAELLFQGCRFTEESLAFPLSCKTVHQLAPKYGASYESAMRRYAERHVLPCAAIVYDKVSRDVEEGDIEDAQYRIQYTIASPSFSKRYFSAVESKEPFSRGSDIFRVHARRNVGNIAETELVVERADKGSWRFETELFTNGYKIFQFITRPAQAREK
ncbi:MAG TPA: ImmA/IrrE family metallo-endopeptidase [Terriglobia bacterium]|nr:ImmA/IrrE family metallo-endopeptidase [Terriglobia bacterium]